MYRDAVNDSNRGLSPLARGTPCEKCSRSNDRRFIPAGAGNTLARNNANPSGAVYPRWRGEHGNGPPWPHLPSGLSPLARGTRFLCHCLSISCRFIPAGAGNTYLIFRRRFSSPVYPRWRGEHCSCVGICCCLAGLSPLARGTRVL